MSTKGYYVMHWVKVSVTKVCQQGLFISNPNEQSDGQKVRYRFQKHSLAEVDGADGKYRRRHWVGCSCEGQEARDADCGVGVVVVGLGTGEKAEPEFVIIGSCNGEGRR